MNESSLINLIKGININKMLNTAGKTINFVNKAIPMYKEFKPTISSIRDSFSKNNKEPEVIDEIKESRPIKTKKTIPSTSSNRDNFNDTLTFFQ